MSNVSNSKMMKTVVLHDVLKMINDLEHLKGTVVAITGSTAGSKPLQEAKMLLHGITELLVDPDEVKRAA